MKEWVVVKSRVEGVKEWECKFLAVSRWRNVRLSVPFISGGQPWFWYTLFPPQFPRGGSTISNSHGFKDECNLAGRQIASTWYFYPVDTGKSRSADTLYWAYNYILTILISLPRGSTWGSVEIISFDGAIQGAIPSPCRICRGILCMVDS